MNKVTSLNIVVMAAGRGTRMKSALPKTLQKLAGKTLLSHVLTAAVELNPTKIVVVVGHEAAQVVASVAEFKKHHPAVQIVCVRQEKQLGTGHAVQSGLSSLDAGADVLVLSGDVPMVRSETLHALLASCGHRGLALLTIELQDATGYGRILRSGNGNVMGIVEQKDANSEQCKIREVFSGVLAAPESKLAQWVSALDNENAQHEYYLTDIVKHAVQDEVAVTSFQVLDAAEVAGINDPIQLAQLERVYQAREAARLMAHGVHLLDPSRLDIRGDLQCGNDVQIDVNCVFEGRVVLGNNVVIGANCVISDATISDHVTIKAFTHIEGGAMGVSIGSGCEIGPFSRLRPGAQLQEDVHIGNFVEVKNSCLARGSKANHLAYLGDASVGENVNYGAGAITANYDGANKHKTVIEKNVHIGSNSVLVAPVTIAENGTIAAGSVITKSTNPNALTIARHRQQSEKSNWQRPSKRANKS